MYKMSSIGRFIAIIGLVTVVGAGCADGTTSANDTGNNNGSNGGNDADARTCTETESACTDGKDNDCDGDTDCEDTDCDGVSCGDFGRICQQGQCTCPGGDTEMTCDDGEDNDCDGNLDCDDDDCSGKACGANGKVCSAGSCSCPDDQERCNGADRDCDGTVDEGCPQSASLCCETQEREFGGPGGNTYDTPCPDGKVGVGFAGRAEQRVDNLQLICAGVNLTTDTSSSPYSYGLEFTDQEKLADHGGSGGNAFDDRCDRDQAIVGINGREGDEIDQFQFDCGNLEVTENSGSYSVEVIGTETTARRGGTGGSSFTFDCPGNKVVSGIHGRAGDEIDRVGVYCKQIEIEAKPE